jgi:hypothetical protein
MRFGRSRRWGVDMKSELTDVETKNLLADAEDAFPDSDFVSSVNEWFDEHGFITESQEEALNRIVDREG